MRLTDACVVIRPRTPWQAIDLGVLLAKQHAPLLMLSWACITLPVFALISLLLWEHPFVALLAFWWLKPAFERAPLYILSRALFGARPSLKQVLKTWPALLKPQLLSSLLWRRPSLYRSFTLPLIQLEGLSGTVYAQRLLVLKHSHARTPRWLTIVCTYIELALYLGAVTLFYGLIPAETEVQWQWQKLFTEQASQWLWIEHAANLCYALVLTISEPLYVSCGFTLYLNRRTALEAWDIELKLRQLSQRLRSIAPLLLLIAGLVLMPHSFNPLADEVQNPSRSADTQGPDAERLLKQPLNSKQAQTSIQDLLNKPPFRNTEIATRWRLGDDTPASSDKSGSHNPSTLQAIIHWLRALFSNAAAILEVLLWSALLALIIWTAWRCREWLHTFVRRITPRKKAPLAAPQQLFGLAIHPESLPTDIIGEVQRLWLQQPREALSLMYRALLSRLVHEQQLALKSAHTESEVLQLVLSLKQPSLSQFSLQLTEAWQNMAYGHQPPPAALKDDLCHAWSQLFTPRAQP